MTKKLIISNSNENDDYQKYKNMFNIEQIETFILYQNEIIKLYHKEFPKKKNELSDCYAVIIEPRSDHLLLEAVCRNVMYFLPDNWNLIVYSYNENMVRERLKFIDFEFHKTDKESFNLDEYSDLLTSLNFWNSIPGENVLIFQTDSYITKKFIYSYIENIKQYPFIGAVYRYINEDSDDDLFSIDKNRNFSMNGGFSFRNKKAMIDCINRIKTKDIINYRVKNNLSITEKTINYEDFYFDNALQLLNYKLPSYDECSKFCSQVIYSLSDSHAVHGIYKIYVYSNCLFFLKPSLAETHDEIIEKIRKI